MTSYYGRFCGYCNKPLKPGQKTTQFVLQPSAGGWKTELHDECIETADAEQAARLSNEHVTAGGEV